MSVSKIFGKARNILMVDGSSCCHQSGQNERCAQGFEFLALVPHASAQERSEGAGAPGPEVLEATQNLTLQWLSTTRAGLPPCRACAIGVGAPTEETASSRLEGGRWAPKC